MAKTTQPAAKPELNSEVAHRLKDPYESNYMGVLKTNDPLLLEKGEDAEIYRDLKRDGKVYAVMQKRIGALVGREWAVAPVNASDQADAERLTALLKQCPFDKLCRDLSEALLMGWSVVEIVWQEKDGWILPERFIKRRQRRFRFVQADAKQALELRLLTRQNMLIGEALPQRKFIVHRVNPEDDNPYGTGLGLQTYWAVFFKRRGIIAWNKLNDRFGAPTPWGQYPRHAGPKEKNTLADALRAFSSDGFVMTPEGNTIQLLESKLTGSVSTQQSLCEYMDDWIAEVWLGQEPRAQGGGALAAASKERQAVRLDLVQADADLLSETLNTTLMAWLCDYNGLAPCTVYRQIKEEEDLKAASETDKNLADMGFELSEDAVRAKYGGDWKKKSAPDPAPERGNFSQKPPAAENTRPASAKDKLAKAASFAEAAKEKDRLDALIDSAVADWQPMMDPLLTPLVEAFKEAAAQGETAAQLIARLPAWLSRMDNAPLGEALTGAALKARLAGLAGMPLDD